MRKLFTASAAAVTLAACNPVAQYNQADESIEAFHQAYSEQDLDALWAMAGPALREDVTRQEWDGLVTMVHGRLGAVEDTSHNNININSSNGLTTTTVIRDTTFANAEGVETFTFYGTGEDMVLNGWRVNSDALIGATLPVSPPGRAAAINKPGLEGKPGT